MSKVYLYSAYYSTNALPFRFEISELKIKRICGDVIETEYPYFTAKDYSTYYFGGTTGSKLDVEHHLNLGTVYYSKDKGKCREWLEDIYKREQDRISKEYDAISSSKIVDKGVDKDK